MESVQHKTALSGQTSESTTSGPSALRELTLLRLRELVRTPEALFWTQATLRVFTMGRSWAVC